jgi:hypothetical protein
MKPNRISLLTIIKIPIILLFIGFAGGLNDLFAQQSSYQNLTFSYSSGLLGDDNASVRDTVPLPRKVMMQSVILPGWGQVTNRQIWKIPIIYGLMGGLTYYSWFSHTQYSGYRAAFYNSNPENTDFRFGPTPGWIDPNAPPQFYQSTRDFYRNRRDFLIVMVALSYVLNFVDAYVYAHMRDFDVSDDLSSRITISPNHDYIAGQQHIGFRFNLRF